MKEPPAGFSPVDAKVEKFGEAPSWHELIGPLYRRRDKETGIVSMGFYSEPRHQNYMAGVHGGMMASFMDYLLWFTALSAWPGSDLVTISLNVDFVGGVRGNHWIEGHGQIVRAGRSIAYVKGEAFLGDKVVTYATGTFRKL